MPKRAHGPRLSIKPEPMPGTHQPHVYMVRFGDGPIKIGYTRHAGVRFAALEFTHPDPVTLLAIFPGARELEGKLHTAFAAHAIGHEWFHPHPDIIKFAEDLNSRTLARELIESIRIAKKYGREKLLSMVRTQKCSRCGK